MFDQILRQCLTSLGCAALSLGTVQAQTTSPFPPPIEKLGTYVINGGPGLDTGCTYRGGGPLLIRLTVPKVVNDTQLNADGTLKNAAQLVRDKVLSAQATIRFPVFDIDDQAVVSGFAPEVDRVTFNGRFKKVLAGFNNTWTDDSIVVPIEELKFGQLNELRIDIDTANAGGGEYWCMAVDWVAIQFEAAAPYVLAHGIDSNAETWDEDKARGVLAELDKRGVLYTRFTLGTAESGNATAAANARELKTNIQNWLSPMKADRVHVIAHSKGGLDAQHMMALAPSFKLLSLSTLSTPHLGSVAADLSIIEQTEADEKIDATVDPSEHVKAYLGMTTFGFGPTLDKGDGIKDLTTYRAVAAQTLGLRGNVKPTFSYGADADLNSNEKLEDSESGPLYPFGAKSQARKIWQVLRDFRSATFTTTTVPGRFWGTRTVLTYDVVAEPTAQANDIAVTTASAIPPYATELGRVKANHGTVKDGANVREVLNKTLDPTITPR